VGPDAIILFRELADRSSSEREEYYARHQVPAAVRAEVESLLHFDRKTVDSFAAGSRPLLTEAWPNIRSSPEHGSVLMKSSRLRGRGHGRGLLAIKVLPPHVARDPDLNRRFEREARILAAALGKRR
jgi:hypothetical protein